MSERQGSGFQAFCHAADRTAHEAEIDTKADCAAFVCLAAMLERPEPSAAVTRLREYVTAVLMRPEPGHVRLAIIEAQLAVAAANDPDAASMLKALHAVREAIG